MRSLLVLMLVLVPGAALAQNAPQPPACERLASLSLPNTAITLAQVVNAGAFTVPANPAGRGGGGSSALAGTLGPVPDVPGRVTANTAGLGLGYNGGRGIPPFSTLPAFCRVVATLKPSASSDIHMEMWMPITGWNGHFRGTSPNGLGGVINYNAMAVGLSDGFAVASTDTGHQGGDTAWMQVPDKVTDFAGRAMHETTVVGKALTAAYYGAAPSLLVHDRVRRRHGGGPARGPEVPCRLQRRRHWRPRRSSDAPDLRAAVALVGDPSGRRRHSAGGEAARHSRCRPGQVRPARRGEGRTARESDPLHVRPEGNRVPIR